MKVLQILTQDTTPSSDLISTVKHLYETKFKVSLTAKGSGNFQEMLSFFFSFSYLAWFSIAGCYNSCSIIVIAFQKGGDIDSFLFFFYLYSC